MPNLRTKIREVVVFKSTKKGNSILEEEILTVFQRLRDKEIGKVQNVEGVVKARDALRVQRNGEVENIGSDSMTVTIDSISLFRT